MQQKTDFDPMEMGAKAYRDGIDPVDGNPFDAGEQSSEWDAWEDGWSTARFEVFESWMKEVEEKIDKNARRVANFNHYFDDGLTPEEAIEENRLEAEKQKILDTEHGDDFQPTTQHEK